MVPKYLTATDANLGGSAGRLQVQGQSFERGALYSSKQYSYKEQYKHNEDNLTTLMFCYLSYLSCQSYRGCVTSWDIQS